MPIKIKKTLNSQQIDGFFSFPVRFLVNFLPIAIFLILFVRSLYYINFM